jgi:hypothetical protein
LDGQKYTLTIFAIDSGKRTHLPILGNKFIASEQLTAISISIGLPNCNISSQAVDDWPIVNVGRDWETKTTI